MEYGLDIYNEFDDNLMKYSGYEQGNFEKEYFSKSTIKMISEKVSELLEGVDEQKRKIVVPDDTIAFVMSDIYDDFRPQIGDINTRYNISKSNGPENYMQDMIDQVIEIIYSDVKNNVEMQQYNSTLTAWTSVYGDFNKHGLQQHPKIKIRNKRPAPMQFNMNY